MMAFETAQYPDVADMLARLSRLERLEEQVFFQERSLNALHEALVLQQAQLDQLETRVERMEEKVRTLWEIVGEDGGETTLPPHYL